MEDHDFKFDSFKWIEHEEYPEIINTIRKTFGEAGIGELLAELDHMENEPNLEAEIQAVKLSTIKRMIADKLDLFDNAHAYYLIDTLPGHIEKNESLIAKLWQAFKEHRHDKDKSFSGVPV